MKVIQPAGGCGASPYVSFGTNRVVKWTGSIKDGGNRAIDAASVFPERQRLEPGKNSQS